MAKLSKEDKLRRRTVRQKRKHEKQRAELARQDYDAIETLIIGLEMRSEEEFSPTVARPPFELPTERR